ncbi:MAG: hypothetical protein ABI640_10825 [Gammaproteobacteria bacterium]
MDSAPSLQPSIRHRPPATAKAAAAQAAATAKATADRVARAEAEKNNAELKALLTKMTRNRDEVEHTTFFHALPLSGGPHSYVAIYIGRADSGSVWMRTRLQYGGPDWIFWQKLKFSIDGVTLPEQALSYFQIQRDNDGDGVWEWVDLTTDEATLSLFNSLAAGKKSIVRFKGKYRYALELSAAVKGLRSCIRWSTGLAGAVTIANDFSHSSPILRTVQTPANANTRSR